MHAQLATQGEELQRIKMELASEKFHKLETSLSPSHCAIVTLPSTREKLAQQVKDTLPTSLTSYKTTSTVVTIRGKQEKPVGKPSTKPATSPLAERERHHSSQVRNL